MNFGEVMAELAQLVKDADIEGVGARCYGWPIGECPVPCLVVGFPEGDIDLNLTMGARADGALVRAKYQAWWIIGAALTRTTPNALGSKVEAIKAAIDAAGEAEDSVIDSALVLTASVEPVSVSGGEHLAVRFVIDVVA